MTRQLLLLSMLTLFLLSCSHKNKLKIVFDRVDNIDVGSRVHLKGVSIGEVTNLELFGDSVLVNITINKSIQITVDSKFIINHSLVSLSYISIEPSDQKKYLTSKDIASGVYLKKGLFEDIISDSTTRADIKQSLDKIGTGIKELIEVRDSATN